MTIFPFFSFLSAFFQKNKRNIGGCGRNIYLQCAQTARIKFTGVDVKIATPFHASRRKYKIACEHKAAVPIVITIEHVVRAVRFYARPVKHPLNSAFNYIPAVRIARGTIYSDVIVN